MLTIKWETSGHVSVCLGAHVPGEFEEANDTSGHVERQESDDDD